jgi:FKBP-type peptidyl-prolyl cis-trans isomerase 2
MLGSLLAASTWLLSPPLVGAQTTDGTAIVEGSNVTMAYHIMVPGETFEIRDVGQFVQGRHEVLPILEREISGMKMGEQKNINLSADEGFGPYDASKKTTVSRSELPKGAKEGDVLQDGAGKPATVTQLSDNSAVMDYNHPLAGKPIKMELKILKVDNSSADGKSPGPPSR